MSTNFSCYCVVFAITLWASAATAQETTEADYDYDAAVEDVPIKSEVYEEPLTFPLYNGGILNFYGQFNPASRVSTMAKRPRAASSTTATGIRALASHSPSRSTSHASASVSRPGLACAAARSSGRNSRRTGSTGSAPRCAGLKSRGNDVWHGLPRPGQHRLRRDRRARRLLHLPRGCDGFIRRLRLIPLPRRRRQAHQRHHRAGEQQLRRRAAVSRPL